MDFCLAMSNFIGFSAFLHSAFSLHHFPIGFTGPTLVLVPRAATPAKYLYSAPDS
jgi:hypothetical protein